MNNSVSRLSRPTAVPRSTLRSTTRPEIGDWTACRRSVLGLFGRVAISCSVRPRAKSFWPRCRSALAIAKGGCASGGIAVQSCALVQQVLVAIEQVLLVRRSVEPPDIRSWHRRPRGCRARPRSRPWRPGRRAACAARNGGRQLDRDPGDAIGMRNRRARNGNTMGERAVLHR